MSPPIDAQALIMKARHKHLSVGETHALSIHVAALERAAVHHQQAQASAARDEALVICLNADLTSLIVTFPGETTHYASLPLGRPDILVKILEKVLRERRGVSPKFIAQPGAPTKADLLALAKAFKSPARKSTPQTVTLDELEEFLTNA